MKRLFAMLAWACLVPFCASTAVATGHARPVVLIVGDSLSSAYRMPASKAWPALLQERLDTLGLPYSVRNASRSGETTEEGLKRIPALLKEIRPAVVVLELGANDGLRRYPLDGILDNLRRMVGAVREVGATPVIVGMRLPPSYPAGYAAAFEEIFPLLAHRHDAVFVPFLLEKLIGRPEYFLGDRLHPNAEGQPLLLDTVWAALYPVLSPEVVMP